jgi:hypothetical protein
VNRTVNDGGSDFPQCPQGYPEWTLKLSAAERNTTVEKLREGLLNDPASREDCLFLDVVVPQAIYNRKNAKSNCNGGTNGGMYFLFVWKLFIASGLHADLTVSSCFGLGSWWRLRPR